MKSSRTYLQHAIVGISMFGVSGVAGCGHSCVSGFFLNSGGNGNGGLITAPANLSSSCQLTQTNGTMNVVAAHASVCKMCAASEKQSVLVTIRGIQLLSETADDANGNEWLELAPQLTKEPRQIRVSPDSPPELLVDRAAVPAGSYRELRIEFLAEDSPRTIGSYVENACGVAGWNCYVAGDGRLEPLVWASAVPEIVFTVQSPGGDSPLVFPDSAIELQIHLAPHRVIYGSGSEPLRLQTMLSGTAQFVRQSPVAEDSALP